MPIMCDEIVTRILQPAAPYRRILLCRRDYTAALRQSTTCIYVATRPVPIGQMGSMLFICPLSKLTSFAQDNGIHKKSCKGENSYDTDRSQHLEHRAENWLWRRRTAGYGRAVAHQDARAHSRGQRAPRDH